MGSVIQTKNLIRLLGSVSFCDDGEAVKSLELTMALLRWSPSPFSRHVFTPGHITCTGVVLSPSRDAVLLVHHRRLDRWLLPGGHVEESDRDAGDTARREVTEETEADLDSPEPLLVGCDVHPIPARGSEPLHLHHDLIFAFRARTLSVACSPESRDVLWRRITDLEDLPGSIRRSVNRAIHGSGW